jgi:hypothetical protein
MPKRIYKKTIKTKKNKKSKRTRTYKRKYRCVTKKYRGGASNYPNGSLPVTPTLPMVIDKNNIAYSCTPLPSS